MNKNNINECINNNKGLIKKCSLRDIYIEHGSRFSRNLPSMVKDVHLSLLILNKGHNLIYNFGVYDTFQKQQH